VTEPRTRFWLVTLSGAALVAAGYVWGRGSGESVEVDARTAPEPEVGTVTVAAASRRAAVIPARAAVGAEPSLAGDEHAIGALDTAEGPDELDPEDEEILAQEAQALHFDALNRRIDTERVDGAWRHETEGPLKQLMTQHLAPKIRVSEATCASSFCRVKLDHPEWSRIPPGWMFEFDLARASLEVTEVQYDNREEGATTLYFKRGPAPGKGSPP
jgi:hypothetical protein